MGKPVPQPWAETSSTEGNCSPLAFSVFEKIEINLTNFYLLACMKLLHYHLLFTEVDVKL